MHIAHRQIDFNRAQTQQSIERVLNQLMVKRQTQAMILGMHAAACDPRGHGRVVQYRRQIQTASLPVIDGGLYVEQVNALVGEAADVAAAVLSPTPFAALGGDRSVVEAVLDARADLAWLRERAIPHFLTVPEPRLRTLEALPYDLYAVRVE